MQQILILGGGAAGLAAALAAAQTAEGRAHITVLDKNAKVGKKLLATGNGRCNLDNRDISPERYFTSSPKALRRLLSAVDEAAPLAWFESLGLYPRTDEAGRVYPYSNQAADVLALLEHHLSRLGVEVRTGCTVQNLSQSRGRWPASGPRAAPACWTVQMAGCLPGKWARCSSPSTGFRASASCSFRVCWPRGAGRSGLSWPSTSSLL